MKSIRKLSLTCFSTLFFDTISHMDKKPKRNAHSQARQVGSVIQFAEQLSRRSRNDVSAKLTGVTSMVTFGLVRLQVEPQDPSRVRLNVAQGQKALARAKDKILKPGIKISAQKGVPLFSADPKHPGCLIRRMDGKTQRGTITGGKFKVSKASGAVKPAKAA